MPRPRLTVRRAAAAGLALVVVAALVLGVGLQVRMGAGARAITLGSRTVYLVDDPSLYVRLHEAVHRRQYRDAGWRSWLRYAFSFEERLRMEAEADVVARCAQGVTTTPGPETWARSRMHETIYAFWWWERGSRDRPDHVAEWATDLENCGVDLSEWDEEGRMAWTEAATRVAALRQGAPVSLAAVRSARTRPTAGGGTETPVEALGF